MGILHDELNRVIGELCKDASVKAELVRCMSARHGVSLSEPQLQSVIQAIENGEGDANVEVAVDGLTQPITINSDDFEHAQLEFEGKLEISLERVINSTLEHMTPSILNSLYAALPQALQERQAVQRDFEERLQQKWQDGLDRIEMLIIMAHESGETYVQDLRREFAGQVTSQESILSDVLVAMHCRACRTAREILCLLKAGYADGANARWRSIHELAVTAFFLLQHRGDTPQRYLDHVAVERWRAAEQYQTHCHTLGYEPFSIEELAEMRKASDDAIARYGAPFREDYGWAAHALATARPSFTRIEADIDMSQWRPFFRLACQSVHAGSQCLFYSLAVPDGAETILLAGASSAGLADPGHNTAISLTMVSVALLTSRPNLDGLVASKCMLMLCDDIGAMLLQSHES